MMARGCFKSKPAGPYEPLDPSLALLRKHLPAGQHGPLGEPLATAPQAPVPHVRCQAHARRSLRRGEEPPGLACRLLQEVEGGLHGVKERAAV
jgi:hypothetical protein